MPDRRIASVNDDPLASGDSRLATVMDLERDATELEWIAAGGAFALLVVAGPVLAPVPVTANFAVPATQLAVVALLFGFNRLDPRRQAKAAGGQGNAACRAAKQEPPAQSQAAYIMTRGMVICLMVSFSLSPEVRFPVNTALRLRVTIRGGAPPAASKSCGFFGPARPGIADRCPREPRLTTGWATHAQRVSRPHHDGQVRAA